MSVYTYNAGDFNTNVCYSSDTDTWKFPIDGKEVSLFYRAVYGV